MAKRQATSELNHDNWDLEEEQEEAGIFKQLSPSEMQNRVIRKAKRSLGNKDSPGPGTSPFSAFSGFGTTSSDAFGSLKKTNNAAEGGGQFKSGLLNKEKSENGSATTNANKKEETAPQSSASLNVAAKEKAPRSLEYYRQLQSLNESILKWMQLHLSKNACCDFTPVFNDYKKHLDTLNVTYPVKYKDTSSFEAKNDSVFKKPASSLTNNLTSNASSAKEHSSLNMSSKNEDETDYGAHFSSNTTNTSTFSFGIKSAPTSLSTGSLPGPTTTQREGKIQEKREGKSQEKKTPQFSFGSKAQDSDSSCENKPFSFSSKPTDANASSGPGLSTNSVKGDNNQERKPFQFTFGFKSNQSSESSFANKPFSFTSAPLDANTNSGESEDVEYVPPKNEFTAVAEENAVYSKRCKLFFKKNDEYAERGVGNLYLKPLDGKTQLLIRADTNLGNVLLNIILSASLPMSRTGKNNVLIVCVPNPPVDAKNPDSKDAIPILIRVKTAEDADDLLETLKKHKS